jgi:hypothetical protein
MKVVCTSRHPTKEQNIVLGYPNGESVGYEISVGKEYVVLGISFQLSSPMNKGVTFLLRDNFDRCAFVPACLLDITDPRPSLFWVATRHDDFDLSLWPREFHGEYFHDLLSDGEPAETKMFRVVCQALELESSTCNRLVPPPSPSSFTAQSATFYTPATSPAPSVTTHAQPQ